MFDKIPAELWFVVAAGFGGVARLAIGVTDDNTTVSGELCRIVLVSIPMGTIAAHYASTNGMGNLAFAVGYLVGLSALNTARTIATDGLKGVVNMLFNMRGK